MLRWVSVVFALATVPALLRPRAAARRPVRRPRCGDPHRNVAAPIDLRDVRTDVLALRIHECARRRSLRTRTRKTRGGVRLSRRRQLHCFRSPCIRSAPSSSRQKRPSRSGSGEAATCGRRCRSPALRLLALPLVLVDLRLSDRYAPEAGQNLDSGMSTGAATVHALGGAAGGTGRRSSCSRSWPRSGALTLARRRSRDRGLHRLDARRPTVPARARERRRMSPATDSPRGI